MGKLAQQLSKQSQVKVFKDGGMAHGDEKQDRALLKKAVKPEALTGKKAGGKVTPALTKAMSKSFPGGATITPAMKKGGKAGCCK